MDKAPTPNKNIIPMENLLESREFQILQGNNVFLILIGKTVNLVKVKSSYFSVDLNFKEISTIAEFPLNSIDELFNFIVNIFMGNNVKVEMTNNEMNLILAFLNNNTKQNKQFSIILKYSDDNINYFIYDLWLKLTKLEKENNSLNMNYQYLVQEIANMKIQLQNLTNNNFTFANCINNSFFNNNFNNINTINNPNNINNPINQINPINTKNKEKNNISLIFNEHNSGNNVKALHNFNKNDTIEEVMNKYRERIKDKNLKFYFIYNANVLNPKKTLKQVGITGVANITVMKGDPPIN